MMRLWWLPLLLSGAQARPPRASNIAADLVRRSPLARAHASSPRRAAALQNYVRQLANCGQSDTSLFVVYHGVTHLNGSVFEDQRARGVRVAGDVLRDACDFDLGAFTETLAPDSFYQTLMSEHAALILLGLAAQPIATATGGSSVRHPLRKAVEGPARTLRLLTKPPSIHATLPNILGARRPRPAGDAARRDTKMGS